MDTLTPSMGAVVAVPGAISGTTIIDDLLDRIGERLSRDCCLRPIDCYTGYAARVTVEMQLQDVYPTEVSAVVEVGTIDPRQPSKQITVETPSVMAEVGAEAGLQPSNLERPIDSVGPMVEETEAPMRRQYVSRLRTKR